MYLSIPYTGESTLFVHYNILKVLLKKDGFSLQANLQRETVFVLNYLLSFRRIGHIQIKMLATQGGIGLIPTD